jgi:hypothetical protein
VTSAADGVREFINGIPALIVADNTRVLIAA